ncbi:MAG: hypothetical protein M3447_11135 [Acidobacteriota bacterium]|nr:hypothetical protein [Acidobacteriota bacterium]
MKPTENNKMELLLRSLAKRASSISDTGNGAQHDDAHLDADELNAFSERSMPPAARARYTAHVADCPRCRTLVTALTAAAGLPVAEIKTEARGQASFWQRLPTFLSPAVLRFAVPALALLAVVTVGLITLRQQPSADYVARNREVATKQFDSKSAPEMSDTPQTPSPGSQAPTKTQSPPAPAQNPAPVAETPARAGEKAKAVDEISTVAAPSEYFARDAPKVDAKKSGEPTFAPEPAAAPASAARPQSSPSREADKNEAVAKQNEEAAGVTATRDARAERQVVEDRETRSRSRKAASAGRGDALSSVQARRSETKQKPADQYDEIREIAGRRFQREGNAWVDVDYDPSRSVITVTRGSEQYRVLVADEPGIRTIAERLAGEVIVIWKGRAYRIR